MKTYLYHTASGRMFEVLALNNGMMTLRCELATFADAYDKPTLKGLGYTVVRGEDETDARAAAESILAKQKLDETRLP